MTRHDFLAHEPVGQGGRNAPALTMQPGPCLIHPSNCGTPSTHRRAKDPACWTPSQNACVVLPAPASPIHVGVVGSNPRSWSEWCCWIWTRSIHRCAPCWNSRFPAETWNCPPRICPTGLDHLMTKLMSLPSRSSSCPECSPFLLSSVHVACVLRMQCDIVLSHHSLCAHLTLMCPSVSGHNAHTPNSNFHS